MEVRRAIIEEKEKIGEVLFQSGLAKSPEDGQEIFEKEMQRGDVYLAAVEDGTYYGIVSWIFQGSFRHELAELYHIGVIPEAKGKGVAKLLFDGLVKDANKVYAKEGKKLRKLYLLTHADNERAQGFYKKMGMVHEATLKDHFYKDKDEFVFAAYFE